MNQERRTVRIGLVQMAMVISPEENIAKAVNGIAKAAKRGANIVCLPELFTTRYFAQYEGADLSDEERGAFLERMPGRVTDALSKAARENDVVVVGGSIYEKTDEGLYNTSAVIDSDGTMLGIYRKTHIPHDENFFEQHYFKPGDTGFKVFDTKFGRISVLICYDQWFPEAARACALMGAEIIFYPTAIGLSDGIEQKEGDWQKAWENVMRGHAIANNVAVAGVNRCGREDKMTFWGGSFVTDAFGRTMKRASTKETIVIQEIDLDHGAEIREGWGFFRNRRPECYSKLVDKVN
jgi:predicted amidohydrolase